MPILSFCEGVNPSAAIAGGVTTQFIEEERLNRIKHSEWRFPIRAILTCLAAANIDASDIDAVVYPWDSPAYEDGRVTSFYAELNDRYGSDAGTLAWQRANLVRFRPQAVEARLDRELRRET